MPSRISVMTDSVISTMGRSKKSWSFSVFNFKGDIEPSLRVVHDFTPNFASRIFAEPHSVSAIAPIVIANELDAAKLKSLFDGPLGMGFDPTVRGLQPLNRFDRDVGSLSANSLCSHSNIALAARNCSPVR
jgi:hypothetical protein